MLDTMMYKVEYAGGYKTVMASNAIESNLFYQVNQDGQRLLLFKAIIDSRTNGTQIREGDYLSICPIETRGGEIPPKDGTFSYNGNMRVLLGTKLGTSRSTFWYN